MSLDGFTFLKTSDVSTHSFSLIDLMGINLPILQLDSKRCQFGHSIVLHCPSHIYIIAGRSQYWQVCVADRIQNVFKQKEQYTTVTKNSPAAQTPLWEIIWIFSIAANLIADKSFFSMYCSLPNYIISIRGSSYCMDKTSWKDQGIPVIDKASDYLKARQIKSNAC